MEIVDIYIFKVTFLFVGILKKPGYSPIDKDRWDDRMSSSSQNNLVNLTSGHGSHGLLDQVPLTQPPPVRPDSRRELSEVERTLKSFNGYHEDILEVRWKKKPRISLSLPLLYSH